MEVYTNPQERNDTNEANLSRVFVDSGIEEKVQELIDRLISEEPDITLTVIQLDMDKSVEIRKSGISYKLQVLREVSEFLESFASENCIVIPHGTRDDVTVIRKASGTITNDECFVSDVLKKIEKTPMGHGMDKGPFSITYSAGIAIYPIHGKSAGQLLQLADGAVRKAKDNGRNGYAIAETGFNYIVEGLVDEEQWERLTGISNQTGKPIDDVIREGFEELFQKHSALYRFCCQETEE